MATEFLRDGIFLLAWFGLMTSVWLGWAQEAPPKRAPVWLGVGSVIGILAALGGGFLVWRTWDTPSALDGQYAVFGVVVGIEVVAAAIACLVLWRMKLSRWFPLAVALVVAAHFIPLAFLLADWALGVLGVVQIALVIGAAALARRRSLTPSFPIGVAMGVTMLLSALIAGARWVPSAIGA